MITYTNDISPADHAMLRASAGWIALSPRQTESALANSKFIIVAKDDERTIGMTRLLMDGYVSVVLDVVVLPAYQGQGIGRELMTRAIQYIKENLLPGEHSYTLLTSADGKEGFYETMGFHRVPNEHEGSGLVMRMVGN